MRDFISSFRPSARRGIAVACAAVLTLSLAACGSSGNGSDSSTSSSSSSSSQSTSLTEMTGIKASGKLGEKPKVTFKTPFTVKNATYQILQKGDGDVIEDGDRLCTQQMILDAKSGEEVDNTWDKNTPECGILVKKNSIDDAYYNLFKGMKVNTTIALGVDTSSGSSSSGTLEKYINVMTIISKSKAISKATGDKVTNIPSNLPKVTLASSGKPSLDLNGYKPGNKLVVQTLIKGKGEKVKETNTVSAHYTGWLASNGKQFDSSWDRGEPSDFALNQVVKGWTQGLTGQTVGSQVLLVIPPSLGYGSEEKSGIPANSTLIFVVDILAAY